MGAREFKESLLGLVGIKLKPIVALDDPQIAERLKMATTRDVGADRVKEALAANQELQAEHGYYRVDRLSLKPRGTTDYNDLGSSANR